MLKADRGKSRNNSSLGYTTAHINAAEQHEPHPNSLRLYWHNPSRRSKAFFEDSFQKHVFYDILENILVMCMFVWVQDTGAHSG